MVVSAVDVLCRLEKDFEIDNEELREEDGHGKRGKKKRSKSVHFADSKGLALTSTILFARENASPPETRRKQRSLKDNRRRNAGGQPAQLLNFAPSLSYKELLEKVNKTKVCLESIVCHTFGIYGRINVKNIAYEKCVSVRYSFDAWQSGKEETAKYILGASTEGADSFFFHIRPPQITADRKMEFAIRYRVCGREYWDNNFGDNYRLVYFKTKPTEVAVNLALLNDRNI